MVELSRWWTGCCPQTGATRSDVGRTRRAGGASQSWPKTSEGRKTLCGKQAQKYSPFARGLSRWSIGVAHLGQRGGSISCQLRAAMNQSCFRQNQEWPPSLRRTGRIDLLHWGQASSGCRAPFWARPAHSRGPLSSASGAHRSPTRMRSFTLYVSMALRRSCPTTRTAGDLQRMNDWRALDGRSPGGGTSPRPTSGSRRASRVDARVLLCVEQGPTGAARRPGAGASSSRRSDPRRWPTGVGRVDFEHP
jgi:hypothetical protein